MREQVNRLIETQQQFCQAVRNQNTIDNTQNLHVYRQLVYSNIEHFLLKCYPLLHRWLGGDAWNKHVTAFIQAHRCSSPYFYSIPAEFLGYLQEGLVEKRAYELAHFEWLFLDLELAINEERLLEKPLGFSENINLYLSSLVRLHVVDYPVHGYTGEEVLQKSISPHYLVIYRDHEFNIQCLELSLASYALLSIVQQQPGITVSELAQTVVEHIHAQEKVNLSKWAIQSIESLYMKALFFPLP